MAARSEQTPATGPGAGLRVWHETVLVLLAATAVVLVVLGHPWTYAIYAQWPNLLAIEDAAYNLDRNPWRTASLFSGLLLALVYVYTACLCEQHADLGAWRWRPVGYHPNGQQLTLPFGPPDGGNGRTRTRRPR